SRGQGWIETDRRGLSADWPTRASQDTGREQRANGRPTRAVDWTQGVGVPANQSRAALGRGSETARSAHESAQPEILPSRQVILRSRTGASGGNAASRTVNRGRVARLQR